jgi:hypothetical protein
MPSKLQRKNKSKNEICSGFAEPLRLTFVLLCLTNVSEIILILNTPSGLVTDMMPKKNLLSVFCVCTLLLAIGVTITQASDPKLINTSIISTSSPDNTPKPLDVVDPSKGHFDYIDGSAIGTSVRFKVDEATGVITGYTVGLTRYPQYPAPPMVLRTVSGNLTTPKNGLSDGKNTSNQSIPVRQNTTIFSSITVDDFIPFGTPMVYANFLSFQGNDVLMMFYDQQGGGAHYYTGQNSAALTIIVPEGTTITSKANSYLIPNGKIVNPGTQITPVVLRSLQLSYDGVETIVTVTNGTISSSEQTISIQLEAFGSLDTFSWIQNPAPKIVNDFWYSDLSIEKDKTLIEDAKSSGAIPAEGWFTNESNEPSQPTETTPISLTVASNCYTYNDPTFNMNFSSIGKNNIDIVVNSEIPAGRIVIINVQKKVIETSSLNDLLVSIDNAGIAQASSLESLMTKVEAKDTTGAYYALMGEQLITVFVYVPHFSTHTISIRTLLSSIPGSSSLILPISLSVVFIAMVIIGLLLQRRQLEE